MYIEWLRGNAQWHLPYVAHPPNAWWWVPLPAAVCLVVLGAFRLPRLVTLTVGILATSAFGYLLFAAEWGGGDNLLAKILNGPTAFWGSAVQITDLRQTLANYPAYLASVSPSHTASHPPGNLLLFRALNGIMTTHPTCAAAVIAAGRPFISGLPMLLAAGNNSGLIAGAILAIPVIIVLGRLAAIPLYVLAAHLGVDARVATLLFLLLPTTLVHLPLMDTVYPLLTTMVLLTAVVAAKRQSNLLALIAGLLFGLSLLFSAGITVICITVAIYTLLLVGWRSALRLGLLFMSGWLIVWALLYLAGGINMPAIFNFLNHYQAEFEAQRSYWLWVRWKWYDFAMYGGIPVAALCVWFLVDAVKRWRRGVSLDVDLFFVAWLAMMVALWFSPAARAEVGRLWAPMMCFAVLFAAQVLAKWRWAVPLVLALQVAQIMVINRYVEVVNSG